MRKIKALTKSLETDNYEMIIHVVDDYDYRIICKKHEELILSCKASYFTITNEKLPIYAVLGKMENYVTAKVNKLIDWAGSKGKFPHEDQRVLEEDELRIPGDNEEECKDGLQILPKLISGESITLGVDYLGLRNNEIMQKLLRPHEQIVYTSEITKTSAAGEHKKKSFLLTTHRIVIMWEKEMKRSVHHSDLKAVTQLN